MTRDRADDRSTSYQCPECGVQTAALRDLHTHWMNVHPEEGHFADIDVADIEVVEE
jgi:hypothetical protein